MEVVNRTIFDSVEMKMTTQRSTVYNVCAKMPPKIVSDGIWSDHDMGTYPSESSLTMLELQIIIIFTLIHFFHFFLKRMGFPYVVSQVMAGFVLGPSLKIDWLTKYKKMLFPYGTEDTLVLVSLLGYVFFIFLNSVQMDFSIITRTGKKAWAFAVATVGAPVAIGLSIVFAFKGFWVEALEADQSLDLLVISYSGCSFAVIASFLSDLDILNSELGRLALSSALVSDFITSIVNSVSTVTIMRKNEGVNALLRSLAIYFAILILVPLIGRPTMKWVVRNTPEGRPVKKIYTYIIVLSGLIVGYLATFASLTVLAGIIVFGFVVPEGPPLGSELVKQLELLTLWFFLPLFVATTAMKVDITILGSLRIVLVEGFFILMIHLIKVVVCTGICQYCKIPKRDALSLSLILSCKGVVDFAQYQFLYDALRIDSATASVMFISALVLGTMAQIGLKSLYDPSRKYAGYQKRNLLHLKPNSELRIVACIQKPSHITPIKNVLDLCCPTRSNPLVVDVLHLMELVGRSSPIFISHRLQERVASGYYNFSGDVIVTFDLFEHDNAGAATVNTYTAISPQRLMHEDICHLALDKLASIIILPFHVRWADDGSVDAEDESIRSLNNKVLERAPCSVGILVNRGPCSQNSSKQIAMIFLGGADDREALCLAKRAIKVSDYRLVVYHLIGRQCESTNWDLMLDEEVLKGVKGYFGSVENVTYEKITIEEPPQTTTYLLNVANQYDFIIVGRRNGVKSHLTAALDTWTEFSELGAIGDLLTSSDTNTNASILVVQQQKLPKS